MEIPDLTGKVALVTGAGQGIGRAVALAYARAGAAVVLFARTHGDVESAAKEIENGGGRAVAVTGDVRSFEALSRAVATAVERFGRLDVVVANAGVPGYARKLAEAEEVAWDETFGVNLKGAWLTVKAAAPHLSQNGSVILVTTGLARGPGRFGAARDDDASDPDGPMPHYGPYSLAKYAVEGLARVLAAEMPQRVNAVNPGVVDSRMSPGAAVKPDDVTPIFLWLASDASAKVTGKVLRAVDLTVL